MKVKAAFLTVKHVDVQRQIGSSECGPFAIAFASSLCFGLDPHTLKYNQMNLRSQFLSCIASDCIISPHIPDAKRRLGKAYFCHVRKVPVYCICQLPWSKDDTAHINRGALVQCSLCKEWYHQRCCGIDDIVIDTPKYKYLCQKCIENNYSFILSLFSSRLIAS